MWYIQFNGQQVGPMTAEQMRNYGVNGNTMVWKDGMAQWQPLYNFPELMAVVGGGAQPMMQPGYQQPYQQPYQQQGVPANSKSKTTAGVLALLLGPLGIQYFYLGKAGAGILTIVLTIVTCGVWEIITFIQGIMMLTMSDQDFYNKYVATTKTFPLF